MSGIIVPSTQLSVDNGASFASGQLEIASGPGISWTRNGEVFTATGSVADSGMPPGLFIPGNLTAANPIATFPQLNNKGQSYLTGVILNLFTAPSGATNVNNLALEVLGSSGGSFQLPMDGTGTNGGKNYGVDLRLGSQTAGQADIDNGNTSYGVCTSFTFGAQVTVGGLAFQNANSAADGSGIPKIYEVLDANLNVLASSAVYYGPISAQSVSTPGTATFGVSVPLTNSVILAANTPYFFGVRSLDTSFGIGYTNNTIALTGNFSGYGVNANVYGLSGVRCFSSAPTSWAQAFADAARGLAGYTKWSGASVCGVLQVFGGARLALIQGITNLAIIVNGTGPTTPGADMNVGLSWQLA